MISSHQVGVFDCPSFTKTSYADEFVLPERQPVTRFHNYTSFVLDTEDRLVPRCFPHFALHISPHRILDYERSALGFGPTGAEYVDAEHGERREPDAEETEADEEKNNSQEDSENISGAKRSESRQEQSEDNDSENQEDEKTVSENLQNEEAINSENMAPKQKVDLPKQLLDEVTANLYKSTAKRVSEECALPMRARPVVLPLIIGNNEDRELYHSVYRRIGSWKTNVVPETWERAQERPLYEDPKAKQYRRLGFSKSKTRLLCMRAQRPHEVALTRVERPKSLPSAIPHIRPSPGYAGFVPKLPVISSPARDPRLMLSTSAATYRNVFSENLGAMEHAHKGPLSKLVTTTTPCNPFNKHTVTAVANASLFNLTT